MNDAQMLRALRAILSKNANDVGPAIKDHDECEVIDEIKNDLEALEYFLEWSGDDHISNRGNYPIWSGVRDTRTFDLYKLYGVEPCGLSSEDVAPKQWVYLCDIHLTPETYCTECVDICAVTYDVNYMCQRCSQAEEDATKQKTIEKKDDAIAKRSLLVEDANDGWTYDGIPVEFFCRSCTWKASDPDRCDDCGKVPAIWDMTKKVAIERDGW
jgi:hypothetical protein